MWAIVALVALRIGIGWHFFQEGASKLNSGSFSSAGFLGSAKGPLAPLFQSMIWDRQGRERLNYEVVDGRPQVNLNRTLEAWDQYRARLARHYDFSEQQLKQAEAVQQRHERQLKWFFQVNGDDIQEYFLQLDRRGQQDQEQAVREVASLRGQAAKLETEIAGKRGPWLSTVGKIWGSLESDLNALATPEQSARRTMPLDLPGRRPLDSVLIDRVIPVFDLIVGICLVLGLFTRTASLAGAIFLASVVATQWPWASGAAPTYYQAVEMLALFVLAAVGAGRFAGLDFFIRALPAMLPAHTGIEP